MSLEIVVQYGKLATQLGDERVFLRIRSLIDAVVAEIEIDY